MQSSQLSRREFSHLLSLLVGGMVSSSFGCQEKQAGWKKALIEAGNLVDEKERYQVLLAIAKDFELPAHSHDQFALLTEMVNQWANPKELYLALAEEHRPKRYLVSYVDRKISPTRYHFSITESDPSMIPLMNWYRGRMLIHDMIEHGNIQKIPEIKSAYIEEARRCLESAAEAYPLNPIIGMYLGKRIPWKLDMEAHPDAPRWANLQREVLERLTHILHWWVAERQLSDGQYGGGWGDDVEMWRKWIPVLVALEDPIIIEAQVKLSEGLFAIPNMKLGYTNKIYDVEHTAEDSADTITPMLHLKHDDREWQNKALRILELMETKWTGRNERGFLQFKSTYFSAEGIHPSPEKACDTVYHPRVIQPALLLWQRTGNERIGKIVLDWMDTWVEATAREEKGKAAGIIPSAIHWPDGGIGGLTDDWWWPGNHDDDPLYVWPSAMPMMLNTLLLCFHMSKASRYLAPIFSMAKIYQDYTDSSEVERKIEGSLAWCASKMHRFMPGILAKCRKLTGDKQFDELILNAGDGYTKLSLTRDRDQLEAQLEEQVDAFRYNLPAFTSEVRWTDRVFSFHSAYFNEISDKSIPSFDPDFLFSMLTGNMGNALYFPMNAVRWRTPSTNFAALVTEAAPEVFRAELFHFGSAPRHMSLDLLLITPGSYQVRLFQKDSGKMLLDQRVDIPEAPYRLFIELPTHVCCVFEVQ